MQFIDDIKDSIQNFIEENSRLTAAIIAIFVILFLSGSIALAIRKIRSRWKSCQASGRGIHSG